MVCVCVPTGTGEKAGASCLPTEPSSLWTTTTTSGDTVLEAHPSLPSGTPGGNRVLHLVSPYLLTTLKTLLSFTMVSFCNFQTLQNGSGIYARPSIWVHTCHVKLPLAKVFCEWKSKCWCRATYLFLKKRRAALF